MASAGDGTNGARHLDGRCRHGPLSNAHGDRLPGKPFLLEVAGLPFFRWHDAADFLRQVNPGLLSQPEHGRVLGDTLDAQLFRQRIKENIAGLETSLCDVGDAMRAMLGHYPALEIAAITRTAAAAVHP